MRARGMWVDYKSSLPRESRTVCSECGAERRYGYRQPFCGKCGAVMIGERKAKRISRYTKVYERGNFAEAR